MTRITTGSNNGLYGGSFNQLPANAELEQIAAEKIKPIIKQLRESDTSSFINSAYLIDLSEEAMAYTEQEKSKMKMNSIINNWLDIRNSLDEEF